MIAACVETKRVMSVISTMSQGDSAKSVLAAQFVMLKLMECE